MNGRQWLPWVFIGLMSAAIAGCDGTPAGGQIGGVQGEMGGGKCKVVDTKTLGVSASSPLGFSAAQVLAAAGSTQSRPLTWKKGGSTTATLTLGTPTAVRFVELTDPEVDGNNSAEIDFDCHNQVEIDLPLGFSTADGAFAETLSVTLTAREVNHSRFTHELDLDHLTGTYQVTEVDTSKLSVTLDLNGTLDDGTVTGTISGIAASRPSGGASDSAVSAELLQVADF